MDLTTAKKLLKHTQKNELIKIIAQLSAYDEAAIAIKLISKIRSRT